MRTRLLAAVAVLTLAATACGEDNGPDSTDEPTTNGGSEATEPPADQPTDSAARPGGAVLDKPWVVQLARTHEDEVSTTMVYLRVTPSSGESTSTLVDADGADSFAGNHHTLVDGAGTWAIPGNFPAAPKEFQISSLTGADDITLDLTKVTAKPEAVSFDPSRAGILRVLGEDDTLTDYDVATGKKTPVDLPEPKSGQEYAWWFSSVDGLPLPGSREGAPDSGVYQPAGTTAGDLEDKVCPDELGGWMLSYPFTDADGKHWAVCQNIDGAPELRFMELSGKRWKQVAAADVKLPKGTEIYAAIPAVS